MKKVLLFSTAVFFSLSSIAQESVDIKPFSAVAHLGDFEKTLHHIVLPSIDLEQIKAEDAYEQSKGKGRIRYGVHLPCDINLNNSGSWSVLPNGDRIWRLQVTAPGALATFLFFDQYYLPAGARLHVYDPAKEIVLGAFTSYNNHESGLFATAHVKGETCILEYYEPVEVAGQGILSMKEFGHAYAHMSEFEEDNLRDANSDPCEVDVKCPEGNNWWNQRNGVVRISVKIGSGSFLCSGSAINNTTGDCTPYILSAQHCGDGASAADYNQWKFYFNYQRSACGTGTSSLSQVMTGAALRANSNDPNITKSDFILMELNNSIPLNYGVFMNGWDRNNVAATSGVGIHHPAGDRKKISTYTNNLVSTQWSGSSPGSHWRVVWAATVTNHGVTEGGSSGSPIFNQNGNIVGILSGGSSFCTSPTAPDLYGKFSYGWDQCGTTSDRQLKPWLDPGNTGVTSLPGTQSCATMDVNEFALSDLFSVYPNPTTDYLFIETSDINTETLTVQLFDALGKLVYTDVIASGKQIKKIDVSQLENGAYMVNVSDGNRSYSKKLIHTR